MDPNLNSEKPLEKIRLAFRKFGKQVTLMFRNMAHKRRVKRDNRMRSRAAYLSRMPKTRLRRFVYFFNPKRAFHFWFSKKGLILGLKITGIGMAVVIFLSIAVFAYFRRTITADPKALQASLIEQNTKFYDRSGKHVIYNLHGDKNRTWVSLAEMSDYIEKATVAIEDKDFYKHGGFSISGVIRAAINNVLNRGSRQGGSTITQQFVKNALLSSERTFTRKIKELILSLEIERLYTKDEILEFYLNLIPYGSTEYGVEAASQSFFGKSAADLTLDEAAMLAALPQATTTYSPYGKNTDSLTTRQHTVLRAMYQQGYITQDEANKAAKIKTLKKIVPLEQKNQFKNLIAPHFVIEVQKQLQQLLGVGEDTILSGGFKVITTLDYTKQKAANRAVKDNLKTVVGDNVALVSVAVDTGQIVALVGSKNYNQPGYGAYDVTLARRQPGSSFKPYVYAQLFYNNRWGTDSTIYDLPTSFGSYRPDNFDNRFTGKTTVRLALARSRNVPAVKAMYIAGVDEVVALAQAMGNKSLGQNQFMGLSAGLGAGAVKLVEHTTGYATLARSGRYIPQSYVLKVENNEGKVIYEWDKPKPEQVLDPQNAYLVTDILTDHNARVQTFGSLTHYMEVPGLTHTVKTGTSEHFVDSWMMGYSHYFATGVWIGNHDNKPMFGAVTARQTGLIWKQFMTAAHKGKKNVPIMPKPSGVHSVLLDANTGYAASSSSKHTRSSLVASWYKVQKPPVGNASYVIDKISKKLATNCTPALARQSVTGSKLWPEILPTDPYFKSWSKNTGYASKSSGPTEKDDVHSCSDIEPVISITVSDLHNGTYRINASVTKGTHSLDKLIFTVNGKSKQTISVSANGTYNFTFVPSTSGSYKFGAKIIDKVLYASEDYKTVAVSLLQLSSPSDGDPAATILFVWNGYTAADNYQICWQPDGGLETCENTVATSHSPVIPLLAGTKYTATVEAFSTGASLGKSPTITFTPS